MRCVERINVKAYLLLIDNQTRRNMSENRPGPSNVVQLAPNPKPLKLELCLNCQNVQDSEIKKPTIPSQNQKPLDKILLCQKLIKIGKFGGRGKIQEIFSPDDEIDLS